LIRIRALSSREFTAGFRALSSSREFTAGFRTLSSRKPRPAILQLPPAKAFLAGLMTGEHPKEKFSTVLFFPKKSPK